MAKVCFANVVKYNGVKYPANACFEVDDNDVDELRAKGCWLVEEPRKPVTLVKEQEPVEEQEETTIKKTTKKSSKTTTTEE